MTYSLLNNLTGFRGKTHGRNHVSRHNCQERLFAKILLTTCNSVANLGDRLDMLRQRHTNTDMLGCSCKTRIQCIHIKVERVWHIGPDDWSAEKVNMFLQIYNSSHVIQVSDSGPTISVRLDILNLRCPATGADMYPCTGEVKMVSVSSGPQYNVTPDASERFADQVTRKTNPTLFGECAAARSYNVNHALWRLG